MKKLYPYLALVFLFPFSLKAQYVPPPCQLEVFTQWGLCLDLPCIPFHATPKLGTPPYQYLWEDGSTESGTQLYSPNVPIYDTCMSVWVTDAAGCKAFGSTRFHVPQVPESYIDTIYLGNDTLLTGLAGVNFNVRTNDHPFTRNFMLIQAPQHGTLSFNPDGTGHFQPEPGWCAPDYFRYSATDTTDCKLYHTATVMLYPEACSGMYVEKPDCNQSCSGKAVFYQNGLLPGPLSYIWSNGSTTNFAEGLCTGPAAVTVTDGSGATQVFAVTVGGESLTVDLQAPPVVCNNTDFQLGSAIVSSGGSDYAFEWSGPGMYTSLVSQQNPKVYCNTDSVKMTFQLHAHSLAGCDVVKSRDIPVLPAPVLSLYVTKPKCPGDTLTINTTIVKHSTPPYHYAWSGPHGVQSNWPDLIWPNAQPAESGAYHLTVTDANGCVSVGSEYFYIPQTCNSQPQIQGKQLTYCSGADLKLSFGWTNGLQYPDEVHWTGPNGFSANTASPVLSAPDPSMSGWYYLTVRLGTLVLQDSALFTISPNTLGGQVLATAPGVTCDYPYQGTATFQMDVAPPYQYRLYSVGNYLDATTNPFTINGIRSGSNWLDVQQNGCVVRMDFSIGYPTPPQIDVQPETCAGGDATITLLSPNPLKVDWTFPDHSYKYQGPSSMSGLSPGVYRLFIADQVTNCYIVDTISLAPYLDVDFTVVDTPTCTSSDGTLLASTSGNAVPPLQYAWNTGSNQNPLDNLPTGGYSLTLTDGNGCHRQENTVLPPLDACIAQLSGLVRANLSCLCSTDNNTVVYPFAKVCANDGQHTQCTFTDNTGYYVIPLTEPGNYVLHADTYVPGAQGNCPDIPVTITDITRDSSGLDFYFCGADVSDRQITGYCEPARPGFVHHAVVQVRNNGFWPADTSLATVQLSPYMLSPAFSITPTQYDPLTHVASWVFPKLSLYEQRNISIYSTVDNAAPLGDLLTISGQVSGTSPVDPYPDNNHFESWVTITGSFDPNDKSVNPVGLGQSGNISPADSILTYTIRFQNTGTDTAFTVVLRDTLDASVLDPGSIQPLLSSHPYRLDMEQGHILVFTFNPIFLPDSSTSLQGSKGFVVFNIRLRKGLASGTPIRNTAAIYFDYNQPVITNTAGNTLVGVKEPDLPAFNAALMPNPAAELSVLTLQDIRDTERLDVTLFSADGRRVKQLYHAQNAAKSFSIPIATGALPSGMYFVEIRSEKGRLTLKLMVK